MIATLHIERFDEEVEVLVEASVRPIGRGELEVGDVEAFTRAGNSVELSCKEENQAVEALLDAWSLR